MDPQLKRGMLEIFVLAALRDGDAYGYKIIRDISPHIEISESTLYPILKRLEASSCVREYSVIHNGRLRKYYSLMPHGEERIRDFAGDWQSLLRAYNFIAGKRVKKDEER